MEVSIPSFILAYKDQVDEKHLVKKHLAVEILLQLMIGKSSELYKKLYQEGLLLQEPEMAYEFTDSYAYAMIGGASQNPKKVQDEWNQAVARFRQTGFQEEDVERIKRMLYGEYVKEFNDVSNIARMFLADYFKGIQSFDYLEEIQTIHQDYLMQILREVFQEEKEVISIVEPKGE